MFTLDQLGKRICIIGRSNSGKSTLADFLSKKLNIPVYHLDQYAHISNSKWVRQSDEVLIKHHNNMIKQAAWIIDGNYSICMPERFSRATSVIWLDPNVLGNIYRYIIRCIKNNPDRPGRLANAQNEFRFWLIKWMLINYPRNRIQYVKLLNQKTHLLIIKIKSMNTLKIYYKFWNI